MNQEIQVPIRGLTIDLDQLLKLADVAGSGGQARWLVTEGLVSVNGQLESRRGRTLKVGDVVSVEDGPVLRVVARTNETG